MLTVSWLWYAQYINENVSLMVVELILEEVSQMVMVNVLGIWLWMKLRWTSIVKVSLSLTGQTVLI